MVKKSGKKRQTNSKNINKNIQKKPIKKGKQNPDMKHLSPEKRTLGQRLADGLAEWAGSWSFIIGFLAAITAWVILNVIFLTRRPWDPYPFILLNLGLSLLAAIQAPVILMSQNRAAERDRRKAEADLAIDRKSEREIEQIQKDLRSIKRILQKKK